MRLFKRSTSDTSPQLVSATPISQDGASSSATSPDDGVEETDKKSSRTDNKETRTAKNLGGDEMPKPPVPQPSGSARKGISTWGRKVGRTWDHLKRSDSSELLSVSGRRRRWSPNRKSCGDACEEKENGANVTQSPEFAKPKRISRVESLRNLFRSGERSNNLLSSDMSSRNVTIQEEDVTCISHFPMEKALSEGALKKAPFRAKPTDSGAGRAALLQEKTKRISRSIHDLQEKQRVLDFILTNQEILKTQEGTAFVQETLGKIRSRVSPNRRSNHESSETSKNDTSDRNRSLASGIKRNLFTGRASNSECESADGRKVCQTTGLEDLMGNLRLGCDESGYDTDSTRAGADSPDSGKSVPPMLKPRSFSITSDDYHGVDLSLPVSTPKTQEAAEETEKNEPDSLDETLTASKNFLSESITTDTTTLTSDGDETDSCDEDTFEGFLEYQMSFSQPYLTSENADSSRPTHGSSTFSSSNRATKLDSMGSDLREDFRKLGMSSGSTSASYRSNVSEIHRTPGKVSSSKGGNSASSSNSQNAHKESKFQTLSSKNRRHSNASVLNLLENAASPCKDSPPASKVCLANKVQTPIRYYSPKRSRSNMEPEALEEISSRNRSKKPAPARPAVPTPAKTLVRRELKTMKIHVERAGNLGISVERREAARPFYVISKMDANGDAARSKQLRVGDEIVRVSGRRLRGMSIIEARNALRSCAGYVELQIAREPTFTFGEEIGDTWGDVLVRTRSDSEVWSLKVAKTDAKSTDRASRDEAQGSPACKVIGALTKSGKNLSAGSMDRMEVGSGLDDSNCGERQTDCPDSDRKVTGMRKFQVVKKRLPNPAPFPRRATSLSMDLITITLEKGATKKLGFTIVGGSDSNKGSMGIFVKDIMAGGQAAEEGTLRAGDEILAINGASMDGVTHAKALQTFKAAKAGKIVLHVGRRDPSHKRCFKR